MSNVKQAGNKGDGDERNTALNSNSSAISALASAVEGTIGPKGLDCMLVDRFGDVTVTNDGATILEKIDTIHPAACMLIKAARAQEDEVGDGTTTATLLASALISEGAAQVARGVPVIKVIEGIRFGVDRALEYISSQSRKIESLDDTALKQVAFVSARGHTDIAEMVVKAAGLVGMKVLCDEDYSLVDAVVAKECTQSEVFAGIILDKMRVNKQMPKSVEDAGVLIVDDALEPVQVEDDALGTDAGFAKHLAYQEEFRENLEKIIELGVKFVAVAKNVDPAAEEMLTDAGVFTIRRLSSYDIARLVELTGAHAIKRSGLKRTPDELRGFLGYCRRVYEDERIDHIRVISDNDKNVAAILIGAATREVKDERERIAKDAAGAVNAAVKYGVVSGGGSIEVGAARHINSLRESVRGMAAYGVDAVVAALKKVLGQITANAGFNPLEKVEDVVAAQMRDDNSALGVDCDTGEIADMIKAGVIDPAGVKIYALKTASEVAEAILRINSVIRKRDDSAAAQGSQTALENVRQAVE